MEVVTPLWRGLDLDPSGTAQCRGDLIADINDICGPISSNGRTASVGRSQSDDDRNDDDLMAAGIRPQVSVSEGLSP